MPTITDILSPAISTQTTAQTSAPTSAPATAPATVASKAPAYNPGASSFVGGDMTAMAMRILSGANDRKERLDMKLRNAAGGNELAAKSDSLKAAKDQHKGEFQSSVQKFMASSAGVGISAKLAAANSGPVKNEADAARRQGINTVTQQGLLSQTIDKANDAADQAIGGQSLVNQAKVADKQAEVRQTPATMQKDAFKSAVDADMSFADSLREMAKGAAERLAQVWNKAVGA